MVTQQSEKHAVDSNSFVDDLNKFFPGASIKLYQSLS